jgi:hypothetical protein
MSKLDQVRKGSLALTAELHELIDVLKELPQQEPKGREILHAAYKLLLPHQVKSAYFRKNIQPQLDGCVSFRSLMSIRSAGKDLGCINHEWFINNKILGADFARAVGVATPMRYGVYCRDAIPDQDEIVIKPVSGMKARGVFIRHSGSFIDLSTGEKLSSVSELHQILSAFPNDEWLVEEYMPDIELQDSPARDLKFYCFYGRMVMALEVVRYPDYRCSWWSRDHKNIDVGYLNEYRFEGIGFDPTEVAVVEKLSAEIPAPFIRIDMLKSVNGIRFGEFTPRPGEYDKFNASVDHELGKEFLIAESRLLESLIAGKRFEPFVNISANPG